MMPMLIFIAVGVYATLSVVVWIALKLRGHGPLASPLPGPHHLPHHMAMLVRGNFAVWEWRQASWQLSSGNLAAGANPGPPPGYPGAFEGETIKTWVNG